MLSQPEYKLAQAAELTGVDAAKIQTAAKWLAKPKADGTRVKASFGIDGFDWNNSNDVAEESSRFSRKGRKAYHMVKMYAHQLSELMKRGHIELSKAAVTAVAVVTSHVKKGVLYANMLDTRQPSNALTARVVDQISGNYNYKMGVAKIQNLGASKYKEEFRSMSFAPRNII